VEELAKAAVGQIRTGDPRDPQTTVGPMVSQKQWDHVQHYIRIGIDEGTLLATSVAIAQTSGSRNPAAP
jgi:aldehyde dehydrogenase (NAD+)